MWCEKCNVQVAPGPNHCPLCQGDLAGGAATGAAGEPVFPAVPLLVRPHRRLIQLLGFISFVAATVCVIVNLSVPGYGWWSLFVVAGLVSFWISFSTLLRNLGNLHKTLIWQVVLLSSMAFIWDFFTGFGRWSIDFVMPILTTLALLAMSLISKIRRLRVTDYMVYVFIDCFIGILCLVFLIFGLLHVVIPSAICAGASIISLGALLIFEGKPMLAEIRRRMHL